MDRALLKQITSHRFAFTELFIEDVQRHAHDVFKRVAKTALRYAVTGEPTAVLVQCAKARHGNSFAGLMGSMNGGMIGKPLFPDSEAQAQEWFERGLAAYARFEAEMTAFLIEALKAVPPAQHWANAPIDKAMRLATKIRQRSADIRERLSSPVQEQGNRLFRAVCQAADAIEIEDCVASLVVDRAFAQHADDLSQLRAAIEDDLSAAGWPLPQATARAIEVTRFFERDLRAYILQQVVELRTERAEAQAVAAGL